ncbi:MAG: flagellar biosynthesis protein FlhF [Sulfurospirillum sp.]|nr:MAG: flagellar biosynthesis protein FlhF [Sulfurospirillum sp.]
MKLYTFTAPTPAEALKKAQRACGEEALVVSTKQLRKKSLTQESLYEVVVAHKTAASKPNPKTVPSTEKETPPVRQGVDFDEEILLNISKTAEELSRLHLTDGNSTTTSAPLHEEEIAADEFKVLKKDIAELTDKIKLLQTMLWEEKRYAKDIEIPPEFAEIYKIAKESGMDEKHIKAILEETLAHMPLHMRKNTGTIKRYFQVLLKKLIPVRLEKALPKGSRKIIMLVGPTGVGKTTTLAKLAARYALLKYRYKVGIITLDTYRIGAVEQLFQYAQMMKLPFEDVIDTEDFRKALQTLSYCDVILIDTVGSSQHDTEKIRKIASFLEHSHQPIDVNLVVSASAKYQDLKDAYEKFSFLDIDTLMITKFDETSGFGNIFSLIYETQKPISYFSTGQEVPDDIRTADAAFLTECLFEGFPHKQKADAS